MAAQASAMTVTAIPPAENMETESPLPSYDRPPVDETALSIQFDSLVGFDIPHFGVYWTRIRDRFPRIESHPPIPNVIEQFGEWRPQASSMGFTFASMPEVRCWFLDQPGNRLLQLQRDRLVYNWRRVTGTEEYPRYPSIRDSLVTEWKRFCQFAEEENLGSPKATQCEAIYVNQIEYGDGWKNYGELHKVVNTFSAAKSASFLSAPERMSMQMSYAVEQLAGRLHVQFVPVIRTRDGKEVLQMTLTTRGAPASPAPEDIIAWLDKARACIVRCFSEFTTDEMQERWGKT